MNALLPPFDYAALPAIQDFDKVLDPSSFTDLPPDWVLGLSDVVDSRGAIAQGRYKAVLVQRETHLLELMRYVVLNPVRAAVNSTPSASRRAWVIPVKQPQFGVAQAMLETRTEFGDK